jgi:hypothetical protein
MDREMDGTKVDGLVDKDKSSGVAIKVVAMAAAMSFARATIKVAGALHEHLRHEPRSQMLMAVGSNPTVSAELIHAHASILVQLGQKVGAVLFLLCYIFNYENCKNSFARRNTKTGEGVAEFYFCKR